MSVLELKNINKSFAPDLLILKDINLAVNKGQSVAIIGKSGTGKSTLLHIAGLLDNPSSGEVLIDNQTTSSMSDRQLSLIRNQKIGFVFQSHMLLEDFTALENVMAPALISNVNKQQAMQRAKALLDKSGLSERLNHYPSQLSGGEKQRVAICRALINKPQIILADEPTGSLDEDNAKQCENDFFELVKSSDCALLLVTHNTDFAKRCDKVFEIKNHLLNRV